MNWSVGDCRYDRYVEQLSVICGQCALARCGLINSNWIHLDLWTRYKELDGIDSAIIKYFYNPAIDYTYEVFPEQSNPNLLLPSKERAIVEYIMCEKWRDEGILIEALQAYVRDYGNHLAQLFVVAEFFSLSEEELDYWLNEAREESDMSMG